MNVHNRERERDVRIAGDLPSGWHGAHHWVCDARHVTLGANRVAGGVRPITPCHEAATLPQAADTVVEHSGAGGVKGVPISLLEEFAAGTEDAHFLGQEGSDWAGSIGTAIRWCVGGGGLAQGRAG